MTLRKSENLVIIVTFALALSACSVQQGAADNSGTPTGGGPGATDTTSAADVSGTDLGGKDLVGSEADATTTSNPGGTNKPCTADDVCDSGICYRGTCAVACAGQADCGAKENCSSDDGKRLFCVQPVYDPGIGTSCAATGVCPGDLKCSAAKEVVSAFCTGVCKDDTDCPMNMDCSLSVNGNTFCAKRKFCGACMHNGNCEEDGACVKMASGNFCTTGCTPGSTECPGYASCSDIGNNNYQCIHKSGSCSAFGEQCDPCTLDEQCSENSSCLSFYFSKESFCSADCTSTSCPAGSKCIQTSQTAKSCIPNYTTPQKPTCVNKLSPSMEKGDIMFDFGMVGVTDTDGDGDLMKEQLRVFHFSDFAKHHKLIYFNVSAGWCSACQAETKEFAKLNYEFYPKGVVIFQAIFDGYKKGQWTFPNEEVLKSWINGLKPQGMIGVDPERNAIPINSKGSTPLNMIIDAKTRKVLEKWNGYGKGKAEYLLHQHLIGK